MIFGGGCSHCVQLVHLSHRNFVRTWLSCPSWTPLWATGTTCTYEDNEGGAFQGTGGALKMMVSGYIQTRKQSVFNGQILSIFDIDDSANILSEPLSEMLAS